MKEKVFAKSRHNVIAKLPTVARFKSEISRRSFVVVVKRKICANRLEFAAFVDLFPPEKKPENFAKDIQQKKHGNKKPFVDCCRVF